MDAQTVNALTEPQGRRLLEQVCAAWPEAVADDGLALASRLRAEHPADLVAAALTQAALRARARARFGPDAARMLFTPDGLEQASRSSVATHRAARLRRSLGPGAAVADLGCGIGGDLLATARAGLDVTGVDRDPLAVAVARANLAELGLPGRVRHADVGEVDRSGFAACLADPARRGPRGRVFDPDAFTPPWEWVLQVLGGDAVVRTAPGLPHERIPAGVAAEWVSDGGDLIEVALWSGALAGVPGRRATVLPSGLSLTDADDPGEAEVRGVGAYLYEPDDAPIRAGLVTAVAARLGAGLLHPRTAYLTADALTLTPLARAYRVEEVLPLKEKVLRALVRARRIGTLTIKKRAVEVDPAALRARLRPAGPERATLVLTRLAGTASGREHGVAILVTPLPTDPSVGSGRPADPASDHR